ncbi:hypothetical protein F4808DRAFT_97552 [Astrocystis sublimbata]|nr:hypothetical protein F4808DRAFT_97552 [Astrocystis sublimbata]
MRVRAGGPLASLSILAAITLGPFIITLSTSTRSLSSLLSPRLRSHSPRLLKYLLVGDYLATSISAYLPFGGVDLVGPPSCNHPLFILTDVNVDMVCFGL